MLDQKAGILLAADGVLAGLVFARTGLLADLPPGVAVVVGGSLLLSLMLTLVSFANRNYRVAPRPDMVARLSAAPRDWIEWRLMGNMVEAVDKNRAKLQQKARWLTLGQVLLLVTLASLGGYFFFELFWGKS